MRKNLLIALSLLLLCACNKQNPSDLVVVGDVEGYSWEKDYLPSDRLIVFSLKATSNSSKISRATLGFRDNISGTTTWLDTTFLNPTSTISLQYEHSFPVYEDTTSLSLLSNVWDNNGASKQHRLPLRVLPSSTKLEPLDNITLYSARSGRKYGFNLTTKTVIFPEEAGEEDLVFFDKQESDTLMFETLTRTWQSNNGVYFSRFESFNFASMSSQELEKAYDISSHDNVIMDIHNDDIIIFGTQTSALGAIKIIAVLDEEGSKDDRYVFSLKMVQ